MRARFWPFCSVVAFAVVAASPAGAWDGAGHGLVARAAARCLPADAPAFLRAAGDDLAHWSVDPDVLSSPAAGPLRARERPEHWLDVEYLQGRALPEDRAAFDALVRELEVNPAYVGAAPYRIVEDTFALALAFAELRRAPTSGVLQAKVVARAGALAHYTADVAQPLHTTLHWDGRAGKDGRSPRTGEHLKMDALLWHHGGGFACARPTVATDVLARVRKTLRAAHARVDRVYTLAEQLPGWDRRARLSPALRKIATVSGAEATQLTADLWWTAWRMSASLELPSWYVSPGETKPTTTKKKRRSQQKKKSATP